MRLPDWTFDRKTVGRVVLTQFRESIAISSLSV
jgi:hypothetical protein